MIARKINGLSRVALHLPLKLSGGLAACSPLWPGA
jgi:hypothetical protein